MDGRTTTAARVARGTWRGALALLSVAVLTVTGYGYALTGGLGDRIATSDVLAGATGPVGSDAAFTALLVGLDSRADNAGNPLPPAVLRELRAGGDEGQLNTDTIILLHVPRGPRPQAVAISFPRDSYVELAIGGGRHKINTAYRRAAADAEEALGGRALSPAELARRAREAGRRALVATVQKLAGVTIDRFAEINLAGFVEITDALGGVPVCLNAPVREVRSGVDLPAGRQVVRGPDALAFVRQRHGLDDGDLDRIHRQQAFLAGLVSTATSSGILTDPARLARLTNALARYVVLDRGWDVDDLLGQLRRVAAGDLRFVTIPTGDPALSTPVDGVAVEVDEAEVRRFVRGLLPDVPRAPWAVPGATTTTTRTPTPTTTVTRVPPTRRTPSPITGAPSTRGTATTTPITADGIPCVD